MKKKEKIEKPKKPGKPKPEPLEQDARKNNVESDSTAQKPNFFKRLFKKKDKSSQTAPAEDKRTAITT
jgi:hypothetical protein